MPAVLRGIRASQNKRLVLELTAMRDTMPSEVFEELLRLAALIETETDERAFFLTLAEIRSQNLMAPKGMSRGERRAKEAQRRRRRAS